MCGQDTIPNAGGQFPRERLDAALDRVEAHVVGLIHEVVLETVHCAGLMRLGGQVAVNGSADVPPRGFVGYGLQKLRKRLTRKRALVILPPVRIVIIGRADQSSGTALECL